MGTNSGLDLFYFLSCENIISISRPLSRTPEIDTSIMNLILILEEKKQSLQRKSVNMIVEKQWKPKLVLK